MGNHKQLEHERGVSLPSLSICKTQNPTSWVLTKETRKHGSLACITNPFSHILFLYNSLNVLTYCCIRWFLMFLLFCLTNHLFTNILKRMYFKFSLFPTTLKIFISHKGSIFKQMHFVNDFYRAELYIYYIIKNKGMICYSGFILILHNTIFSPLKNVQMRFIIFFSLTVIVCGEKLRSYVYVFICKYEI